MKTALITGASGAIGSAIVKKFIENGYFVVAQYNNDFDSITSLIEQLKQENQEDYILPIKADFLNVDDIYNLYNTAIDNFSKIDVLVNNAGVDLYKLVTETTVSEFDKIFDVNVKASFLLSKLCLKQMIERKYGKIINVSSIWGKSGGSMETVYSASKSALIGFTKALAKEVSPSNINVNCICPGVIKSKMNDIFDQDEINQLIEKTPLNRMGTPMDVASLVYFLSSEQASFITGEIITADGGFTL